MLPNPRLAGRDFVGSSLGLLRCPVLWSSRRGAAAHVVCCYGQGVAGWVARVVGWQLAMAWILQVEKSSSLIGEKGKEVFEVKEARARIGVMGYTVEFLNFLTLFEAEVPLRVWIIKHQENINSFRRVGLVSFSERFCLSDQSPSGRGGIGPLSFEAKHGTGSAMGAWGFTRLQRLSLSHKTWSVLKDLGLFLKVQHMAQQLWHSFISNSRSWIIAFGCQYHVLTS